MPNTLSDSPISVPGGLCVIIVCKAVMKQ